MSTQLTYAIRFVGDMQQAVRFHQEQLGLALRFESPGWSEFDTGATTLALHLASADHPAGSCQLGFGVPDLERFYDHARRMGVEFSAAPAMQFGRRIARFRDPDGAESSVSGPPPAR